MNRELINELGVVNESTLSGIEYAQECIRIYDETLRFMGLTPIEPQGQTISVSEIEYKSSQEMEFKGGHISEDH